MRKVPHGKSVKSVFGLLSFFWLVLVTPWSVAEEIEIQDSGRSGVYEISDLEFAVQQANPAIKNSVRQQFPDAALENPDSNEEILIVKSSRSLRERRRHLRLSHRTATLILYQKGKTSRRYYLTPEVLVKPDDTKTPPPYEILPTHVKHPAAPGYSLLVFNSPDDALEAVKILRTRGVFAQPQLQRPRFKKFIPNDPFFSPHQWFLKNTGQAGGTSGIDVNVESAWNTWRGSGVTIAVLDDSVQTTHPDLTTNCPPVSSNLHRDLNSNDNNPAPTRASDTHGTAVAGIAAGRGNNSIGISGVAPEAQLLGIRLISQPASDSQEAQAFGWRTDIVDISSNSWGPSDGDGISAPGPLAKAAIENAINTGRDGRGTIFIFAGGNGRQSGDNSNYDGYANSIYTISVTGCTDRGAQASISEPGANHIVCAPMSGSSYDITTTDLIGSSGYNKSGLGDIPDTNYTNTFGGTSAATPEIAGVVALMLNANPDLGWRDVQEILIRTARKISPADSGWANNSAGFHFNHKFGAGLADASAATTMSDTWVNLAPATAAQQEQNGLNVSIPDNQSSGITRSFTFDEDIELRIEQVEITVDITHTHRSDLEIVLTSPSGMQSVLAERHNRPNSFSFDDDLHYPNWTFSSVRHWGEETGGTWTVRIRDLQAGTAGTLRSLKLKFHGTPTAPIAPNIVSIAATTPSITENGANGLFTVSREGWLGSPLTVSFSKDGSATNGIDYTILPNSITIPAFSASATLPVSSIDDTLFEGTETIALHLTESENYVLGTPSSASMNLNDNETSPAPETIKPKIAISTPAQNARIFTSSFVAKGTASDNQQVADVYYSLNNAGWSPATGTQAWTTNLSNLVPGLNFLSAKAVDIVGNESAALQRSFTYVVLQNLNITIGSGTGSVTTGFLGITNREVGKTYKITALPARGMVFDGWTGDATSLSRTLSFTMPNAAATLSAHFVPNPFTPLAGTYNGLIKSDPFSFAESGFVRMKLTPLGKFSAKIFLGSFVYAFKGELTGSGLWTGSVPRKNLTPLQVSLELDVSGVSQKVLGSINDSASLDSDLLAERASFHPKTNPCPYAGYYTLALNPDLALPKGSSYGTLKITTAGKAVLLCFLADGSKAVQSFLTGASKIFPFHALLYKNKGILTGDVTLETSILSGELVWMKPPNPIDRYFAAGFSGTSEIEGALYNRPEKGSRVLDTLEASLGNGELIFSEGNLPGPLSQPFSLDTLNRVTLTLPNPQKVQFSVKSATGYFQGSFLHPNTQKAVKFRGILLQEPFEYGAGFFLGVTANGANLESGNVLLQAAP